MNPKLARILALGALALPACVGSADTSSGHTSILRVQGGLAKRGSIAEPATTSPATAKVFPRNATIFAGVSNKFIRGIVGSQANAVALGVAGDVDYWLVPALSPDPSDPDSFDFTADISISPEASASPLLQTNPDGTRTLQLSSRAVDNAGNFGPATIQPLVIDLPAAAGALVVSLQWDTPTDLDLHVVVSGNTDGGGGDVWAKHRSADRGNAAAGIAPDGTLDFDSNADCQIDGRDMENVIWQGPPPIAHYTVRVAAASLCGLTSAAWYARASAGGVTKGEASGVLTEAAMRSSAGEGSGVTVFEFDYP